MLFLKIQLPYFVTCEIIRVRRHPVLKLPVSSLLNRDEVILTPESTDPSRETDLYGPRPVPRHTDQNQ